MSCARDLLDFDSKMNWSLSPPTRLAGVLAFLFGNKALLLLKNALLFRLTLSADPRWCGLWPEACKTGFSVTSSVYQAIIGQVTDNATFQAS
jgi:hypothetical protein